MSISSVRSRGCKLADPSLGWFGLRGPWLAAAAVCLQRCGSTDGLLSLLQKPSTSHPSRLGGRAPTVINLKPHGASSVILFDRVLY